jgi:hypothetical protein
MGLCYILLTKFGYVNMEHYSSRLVVASILLINEGEAINNIPLDGLMHQITCQESHSPYIS